MSIVCLEIKTSILHLSITQACCQLFLLIKPQVGVCEAVCVSFQRHYTHIRLQDKMCVLVYLLRTLDRIIVLIPRIPAHTQMHRDIEVSTLHERKYNEWLSPPPHHAGRRYSNSYVTLLAS